MEGATPATARWAVSSVLSVLPPLVGDDLITRILAQLPPGYALLFKRADLSPASQMPAPVRGLPGRIGQAPDEPASTHGTSAVRQTSHTVLIVSSPETLPP